MPEMQNPKKREALIQSLIDECRETTLYKKVYKSELIDQNNLEE